MYTFTVTDVRFSARNCVKSLVAERLWHHSKLRRFRTAPLVSAFPALPNICAVLLSQGKRPVVLESRLQLEHLRARDAVLSPFFELPFYLSLLFGRQIWRYVPLKGYDARLVTHNLVESRPRTVRVLFT